MVAIVIVNWTAPRYYRANSVRYPTPACEGVCALHHYCAITRVDYREFRQCLETAASALASSSKSCGRTTSNTMLLLSIFVTAMHHAILQSGFTYAFNKRVCAAAVAFLIAFFKSNSPLVIANAARGIYNIIKTSVAVSPLLMLFIARSYERINNLPHNMWITIGDMYATCLGQLRKLGGLISLIEVVTSKNMYLSTTLVLIIPVLTLLILFRQYQLN